jgi:hypothetical protein
MIDPYTVYGNGGNPKLKGYRVEVYAVPEGFLQLESRTPMSSYSLRGCFNE